MLTEPGDFVKITFHPEPQKRLLALSLYCGAGIFLNFLMMQVFCMPVWYAAIMCIAFFTTVASFPFIRHKALKLPGYFFLGIGVPICLYCIIFLADPYDNFTNYLYFTPAIFLMGLGSLAFIPFYLLLHIYKYFVAANNLGRILITAGIAMPFIALFIYLSELKQYAKMMNEIAHSSQSKSEFYERLPRNYFTERRLGLHWKYHTRICFYDGWRPPLNDPFFIIGLWCSPIIAPGNIDKKLVQFLPETLSESVYYYKKLFPEKPLKAACPCSYSRSGREYLSVNMDSLKN